MTQDTHPSKGAQEPVATRQILGEALVGLKFARGRLLQLWTDYHTRPKTSVIDGVIRRVEHALAAPPRDAASQTPTPDPKSQVTGDLDYWADVALENHTGREVALTRAEAAEARNKALEEALRKFEALKSDDQGCTDAKALALWVSGVAQAALLPQQEGMKP